jgi:hypothetical protein
MSSGARAAGRERTRAGRDGRRAGSSAQKRRDGRGARAVRWKWGTNGARAAGRERRGARAGRERTRAGRDERGAGGGARAACGEMRASGGERDASGGARGGGERRARGEISNMHEGACEVSTGTSDVRNWFGDYAVMLRTVPACSVKRG